MLQSNVAVDWIQRADGGITREQMMAEAHQAFADSREIIAKARKSLDAG